MRRRYDVVIVGAGILGVAMAFWLSELYECSILLLDKEEDVAFHTSSRNTGVVHRPFYLNPDKKRIFASAAAKSYFMWSKLAERFDLPWSQVGTLEVATGEDQLDSLELYRKWAVLNGMGEEEVELLDASGVKNLEPLVSCMGAIHSKTDTSVDYKAFTHCLFLLASRNGVRFQSGVEVIGVKNSGSEARLSCKTAAEGTCTTIAGGLLLNAAGGGALDIAHMAGLATDYTDLHFRGEYWVVDESFASRVRRHVYSVAKFRDFPFLDPHFIVRANGLREVGPNAVLVSGPNAYGGLSKSNRELIAKVFEKPMKPKLRLFTNRQFLSLVWGEWFSSLSKRAMCARVQRFIPSLDPQKLVRKGFAGVRSSLIDEQGFIPEAIQVSGATSVHVLNYNSPGATGAPAYSAHLIEGLSEDGYLDGLSRRPFQRAYSSLWDYEKAKTIQKSCDVSKAG